MSSITTQHGDAQAIEYETEVDEQQKKGTLILPQRMKEKLEGKVPCVLVYKGKTTTKAGKQYHDLRVIEVEQCKTSDISKSVPCLDCIINGIDGTCFGYCPSCGGHQPADGSQCPY